MSKNDLKSNKYEKIEKMQNKNSCSDSHATIKHICGQESTV
jgi:hypothetical protein